MDKRKGEDERTKPSATPLFITLGIEQWLSTTSEMERTQMKPEITKKYRAEDRIQRVVKKKRKRRARLCQNLLAYL